MNIIKYINSINAGSRRVKFAFGACLFMVLTAMALNPLRLEAAFKDPGYLARPAGMGGAFTSVSGDISSAWYNPAAVTDIEQAAAIFTYSKPYLSLSEVDISMSYASYLLPLSKYGIAGLGYARFDTAGLYQESTLFLTYAYDFKYFSSGFNLKYLGRAVTTDIRTVDDSVFANGTSRSAVTMDLGFYRDMGQGFGAGLCAKNLTQPDVGYYINDPVPMELRGGVSYFFGPEDIDFLVSMDIASRNNEYNAYLGGEAFFNKRTLGARLGGNKNEVSLGGSYIYRIEKSKFDISADYSFSWPFFVEATSGSHRLSLGLKF
ncbi:MAG: hypothetical protein A2251_00275 [Elusimicrobia bacterium RIFOXYA2_FULL_47_53]|nr:MAG: hypothetical protein A2278_00765 [Elusimicrobia bacterium RIFOXYA12_FULL_49_49]OGS10652.1 MAG: hypothetical protein A2386_00685 [Elusimicrobia bacterium RIFOXYB1_FULL_48_9]OGS15079.1 MAG: hypothetical protein A2251_00275 [Elusimicrobia bacterium RIFOXYA2_FULL_47_53]OGS29417.1 MAG: hypothetical protein A2323_00560 [Elusimicrobia bacterium RIFOXYB2_FULL_46_23]